jgi:AcrR family transcriptional regulator
LAAFTVPRAGLSTASVVDAALAIVDESGPGALTLAAVAARCGVATPSLYKHVASLGELTRLVRLRVGRELGEVFATATANHNQGAEDAVRSLARAYRGFARAHPHRFVFYQTPPDPSDAEATAVANAAVSVVVGALAPLGLSGDLAIHAARCVRASVQGFATLEASGGFGLPLDLDVTFEHLLTILLTGLTALPSRT